MAKMAKIDTLSMTKTVKPYYICIAHIRGLNLKDEAKKY